MYSMIMRPPQLRPPRPQPKLVLPVSGTAVPPPRAIYSPPVRPAALNVSSGPNLGLWVLYAIVFMHFSRVFDRFLTGWHIPGALCSIGILTVLMLGGIRQLKFAPGIALSCVVGWMTLSAPQSIWRVASISYVFSYLIYWFPLMILVACVPRSSRDLIRISAVSVAASFFQITGGTVIDGRLGGSATFGNPDDFALLSGFGIPFMVLIAQRLSNPFLSFAVMGTGVFFLLFTMFRTATRAVLPALVLMLAVYFFNSKAIHKIGLLVVVVISAVAMVFVLPHTVIDRLATIFDSLDSQRVQSMAQDSEAMASTAARKELLADAIKLALDNPFLGVGPGEFADYRREYLTYASGGRKGGVPSHNTYAQIAAETGIPGVIFYIVFLITIYTSIRRVRKLIQTSGHPDAQPFSQIAIALQAALAFFAVSAFFMTCDRHPQQFLLAGLVMASERLILEWIAQNRQSPAQRVQTPNFRISPPLSAHSFPATGPRPA